MNLHFDKNGQPLELFEWAKKFEDKTYRIIGRDIISGRYRVSTIWLGLSYDVHGQLPIGIFETCVFDDRDIVDEVSNTIMLERYDTLSEAQAGHDNVVHAIIEMEKIRGHVDDPP